MNEELKLQEMEFIKDWCITIFDFLTVKMPEFKQFVETAKKPFNNDDIQYDSRIYKGFKEGFRDINDFAKSLSSSDYLELNNLLTQKFGKNIEDENKKNQLEKIIKRGKITKDNEYRLLDERVDELSQNQSNPEEIEILNKLLLAYQQSKGN